MTPRGQCLLQTVQDLIDPISGLWDEQLISENFWPVDAAKILHIPLLAHGQSDFIAWTFTKSGCFTVNSAYREAWKSEYRTRAHLNDGEGRMDTHPVWKILWGRAVPSKVHIFNWRALHGFIPCLCTLANRHMKTPMVCQVCSKDTEDLRHMLFTCDRATEVWKELGLLEVIEPLVNMERSIKLTLDKSHMQSKKKRREY